jgi:hypothetical protein
MDYRLIPGICFLNPKQLRQKRLNKIAIGNPKQLLKEASQQLRKQG